MDFFTIKTSTDLTNKIAFDTMLSVIGYFTQPLLMGSAVLEDSLYIFRFAVRGETLAGHENELVEMLIKSDLFHSDTELVLASRI